MNHFPVRVAAFIVFAGLWLSNGIAQTSTVIQANEAAAHVNQYATVDGVVAKVFTSKSGKAFLNIGAAYPNQTFTGWIPPYYGPRQTHCPLTNRLL